MRINPLLRSDGSPERREGEAFIWDCSFVRFQYSIRDSNGFIKEEYFGFGQLYLSLFRLVFIWKPACSPQLQALELDLSGIFEETIQQELFGPPVFRASVNEHRRDEACSDFGSLEFSCFHTQDEGKTYQVIQYVLEMARISSCIFPSSNEDNHDTCLALLDPDNPQFIYLFHR
ncbi:hypothetical protein GpartN1_g7672.t1 [Galdieria partita]|uniref:Uncharacterized protein n=1 Tax=Galdieria partita TaxID=83374 RepID=A0A9C7UUF5_9RHOD|nr:hypothetical protein GpartN1_g7672.t1 [Galdieria partita]